MKTRFTYRELTLVMGIVVALIVVFSLWSRQPFGSHLKTKGAPADVSNTIISQFYTIKESVIKGYFGASSVLLSKQSNPY